MKKTLTMIIIGLLCFSMFLTIGVPAAQATVETGWPVSQPNTPRNEHDIYIDFEDGIEGIEIESTNPNLKFTTTYGLNWRYADIRTGYYNVYPYGSQAYECRGNFFAWLGVTGDAGRIDFPGGAATYCSILVSTYSGVVVDAYNSDNQLISTSGWAGSNINTRTFTRLTVDAPAGDYISYVIIHDTGNYWLLDELCTDAKPAVIPVPGRSIGDHSDRFDIVFVPDSDYGSPEDIDTWLPTFIDHVNDQIDERLGGAAPVSGNLDKFNFYYTRMQGIASSKTLPDDLTKISTFADAYVIFHTTVFGDSTSMGPPSIYGAEGPVGRSFIHESGHGIFGLADEYDGPTYYFAPNPYPNIWATQADGRTDAAGEYAVPVDGEVLGIGDGTRIQFGPVANGNSPNAPDAFFADTDIDDDVDSSDVRVYLDETRQSIDTYGIDPVNGIVTFGTAPPMGASVTIDYSYVDDEGWNPFQIQRFTERQGDWWKLGTTRYIMYDGDWFAINGWGKPAARRIQWFLDQYPDSSSTEATSPRPEKSIWLNLEVSAEGFHLIDESYIINSPPDYLPGTYDFTAKVFSTSGELLGEYEFNDPRRIIAESDYQGPTWLDSANFQLILPYFNRGGRVDLTESATGNVELSVDISKYVTPYEDVTPPTTTLTIGEPHYVDALDNIYVSFNAAFTLTAEDNPGGTGVESTFYRIYNNTYDTGWLEYSAPFYLTGLPDGEYSIDYYSTDTTGNTEAANTATVILDNTPPSTTLTIGEPKYISDTTYVTPDTPFTLEATDTESNIYSTAYRIHNATYNSGWQTYSAPFYLTSLTDGAYTIEYNSTDNVQNTETTHAIDVTLFSWNYIYQDTYGRGTTLKINLAHKFFQFIRPGKDYGIRNATCMKQCGRAIILSHCDSELCLITVSVDTKIDFCFAMAWDLQTRKCYLLIDKVGIE